jgi:hypothetical protein
MTDPQPLPETTSREFPGLRPFVWAVAMVIFVGWAALARVHTHLGVAAGPFDKDGREVVWRVWWRARDDFVSRESPLVVAVYLLLIITIVGLSAVALWIALAEDDVVEDKSPRADAA